MRNPLFGQTQMENYHHNWDHNLCLRLGTNHCPAGDSTWQLRILTFRVNHLQGWVVAMFTYQCTDLAQKSKPQKGRYYYARGLLEESLKGFTYIMKAPNVVKVCEKNCLAIRWDSKDNIAVWRITTGWEWVPVHFLPGRALCLSLETLSQSKVLISHLKTLAQVLQWTTQPWTIVPRAPHPNSWGLLFHPRNQPQLRPRSTWLLSKISRKSHVSGSKEIKAMTSSQK